MATRISVCLSCILTCMLAVPAWAHHAFGAEFDQNKPINVRGAVVKWELTNPHSWIHIDVKGPDGKAVTWMIEGARPNDLYRLGFTKESLPPPGSEVLVEGYQAKNGSTRAVGRNMTFSDGRKLFLGLSEPLAQGRRGPGAPPTQAAAPLPSDPLAGPVVTGAPYAGDAVTTVTQILNDGTRIEQKTEAKFYRDSTGRVRREQTILGLPTPNGSAQPQTVVTIADDMFSYTLDAAARTARRGPRALGAFQVRLNGAVTDLLSANRSVVRLSDGGVTFNNWVGVGRAAGAPAGTRQAEESLGTRQIEGVRATGRKTTNTIPTGQIGNDRPIEITDERWESPDLKLLIYSRFADPRTGVVEFKLTNINRSEPSPDLFAVPADYTVIEPGAGARGGRAAGPGERGRQ